MLVARAAAAPRFAFFLPVLLLTAACSDSDAVPDAPIHLVRDSAGIEIVENGPVPAGPTSELGEPLLSVGAIDGPAEYLLSGVTAVALLDDGGLAIADRSRRIRFYEADGSYFGSFGREGDGPGEFGNLAGLWQRADGDLVAMDGDLWRITVLSEHSFESTYPVRPPGPNPPEALGLVEGEAVPARVALLEQHFDLAESGFEPTTKFIRLAPLAEGTADTVLSSESARYGRVGELGSGGIFVSRPTFEADFYADASGGRLVTAHCGVAEFRVHDPDGSPRGIVRWDGGDRSISAGDVAAFHRSRVESVDDPDMRQLIERRNEVVPVADRFPACEGIGAVASSDVWVRAFRRPGGASQDWHVFRDGRLIGTLRVPAEADLMAVLGARLATLERDELDIEHVRVYELPGELVVARPADP